MLLIFVVIFLFKLNCIAEDDFNILKYNLRDGPQLYEKYVKKYHKTFKAQREYQDRYNNFMKTLRKINVINSRPNSQKVRPNQFADLSTDERNNVEQTTKIDSELKFMMEDSKPSVDSLFKNIIMF